MQVKVVKASTVKEAMEEIKDALGSDAVILHTKKYRESGGLLGHGQEMVEVTAAIEDKENHAPPKGDARVASPVPILPNNVLKQYKTNGTAEGVMLAENNEAYDYYRVATAENQITSAEHIPLEYANDNNSYFDERNLDFDDMLEDIGEVVEIPPTTFYEQEPYYIEEQEYHEHSVIQEIDDILPTELEPASELLDNSPVDKTTSANSTDEVSPQEAERIRQLEAELTQLKKMLASVISSNQPKEVVTLQECLKRQDVMPSLCEELAGVAMAGDATIDKLDPRAKDVLAEYLNKIMKFADGIKPNPHAPRIVALIGTTGVGKTTTLAKIAARFVLEKGLKGALITADTYRISAVEQLKTYAEILGLPVEIVYSANELRKALQRHRGKDFILIDTAGRSQYNTYQMKDLEDLLAANPRIEKHLVLSATTKEKDALAIMDKFAACKPEKVIFTKVDETSTVGMVLNVLAGKKLALSYISNGQSVPDDIMPATAEALATVLLRD